jgi:peptidoglycan hydrolase-like protein with peptidoglycan-binding domain
VTSHDSAHRASPLSEVDPEPVPKPGLLAGIIQWHWRLLLLLLVGAVIVAAGVGASRLVDSGSTESSATPGDATATTTIERGTISATESWDGTLERGSPFTIKSGAAGTVTRLAGQGQIVERGDELYRVNERAVALMIGTVPMYRDARPGDSGADVEQLASNFSELGYGGFTLEAVRRWQGDMGVEQTGTVARGDVVFVPGAGRVDSLHVSVGDVVMPGAPVIDVTGTNQVVTLAVDIEDRDRFDIGAIVTVVLPTGNEVAGTVSTASVVKAASAAPMGSEAGPADSEPIIEVEIALGETVDDSLVGAPVSVIVAIDERTNVLLVPINALLALAEGVYGLEVIRDDGASEIVKVDTGLFADGKVEVSGEGIAEGMVVGAAGR